MRLKFLSIALLISLFSCHRSQDNKKIETPSNSVKEEESERFYSQLKEAMIDLTKKINLRDISGGTDSFELRIWVPINSFDQKLIDVRFVSSNWLISESYVWQYYPDRPYKRGDTSNSLLDVIVDSVKTRNIVVKDTEKFIDTLLNQYVLHFPTQDSFYFGADLGRHSYRYFFEVSDKNSYTFREYIWDSSAEGKFHKEIRSLFSFLERHLKIKMIVL